jgi:hypothetical protein
MSWYGIEKVNNVEQLLETSITRPRPTGPPKISLHRTSFNSFANKGSKIQSLFKEKKQKKIES